MQIDMNLIATFSSFISIILGIIAIWLSLHFYDKAKQSEKNVEKALEGIQAQANMLKDITSKQMTRLIKGVTEQKPIDDILAIISTVRNVPENSLNLQLQQQEIEALTAQAIEGYIGAYYYSAVSNFMAQILLPDVASYDQNNQNHAYVKSVVDISCRDFYNLHNLLSRVEATRIQNNPVYSYYQAVEQIWASRVKDSATHFVDAEQGRTNPEGN